MPWLRKSVFCVFLVVYLVTCPLLILYVLGYVMQPGTAQGMMRTGLISLATAPPGASIYVGGRRYLRRTPAVVESLSPGEYRLKVVLKHHHPWSRTVQVEGEQATVLEKIVLVPTHPAARVLVPGPIKELIPVPQTRFLVLSTGPKIEDLVVYDRDAAEPRPLIPIDSPFRGSRVLSSVVVKESPFLLLHLRTQEGEHYLSVSLKSGEVRQADLLTLFPGKPQEVTWEPRRPQQLFSVHDGSVYRIDLEGLAVSPSLAVRVRGFGVHDQRLYVLTEEGLLQRLDPDGGRLEALFQDPLP
ncbi:MAG: PEGA domain-containing protein, partial [Candidatus Omnitrophica bacterium]|nr:PEGA domain-containing protein [Candidatus Omnitrophota bacterium]